MPENIILSLKNKISKQWKIAFYSTIIIGLLTHLFIFTNRLMNHDSLLNIHNTQAKVKSGRFFLGPASGMSSFFDLPWVIGLLSILFIAFAVICIVELFELRKSLSIILVAGIVVTFPSVTSTFSYMFTADGYMFGSFIAILAVLITKKYKKGFIFGSILLSIAIGVYQANLSVFLAFFILWLLREILCFPTKTKEIIQYGFRFLSTTILGLGLYFIIYKISTSLFRVPITDYQGLNKVGSLPVSSIPTRLVQIKEQLIEFFFRGFFSFHGVNLLEVLNVLLFTTIVIVTTYLVIKRQIYKNIANMALMIFLIFCFPFAYYIVYFLSPDTFYHMLMVFSMTTVYLFLIIIYDTVENINPNRFEIASSWASVVLLSIIIFNFAIIANITYFNMEVRYEKSMAHADRVLNRIEQLDDYEEIEDLAIVGRARLYSEFSSITLPNKIPNMIGAIGETFLFDPYHYKTLFETFYGFPIELTSTEHLDEILTTPTFKDMDVWPAQSSIKIIDGTVVVKFAEQ